MVSIVAICLPAVILTVVREHLMESKKDLKNSVASYLISLVMLNFFMLAIMVFVFKDEGSLTEELNTYNSFAFKYLAMSLFIAFGEPFLEKWIREGNLCVVLPKRRHKFTHWRAVIWIYALVMFGLYFIRIFENSFWGDEGFTIKLAKMSVAEMMMTTANDVHPPLYYLIMQIFCRIFGFNSIVYHLVSIIPYGLILILCMTVVWKWLGKETAAVMITCSSLLTSAINNIMDIRMYSWAALFVLLSFLSLYKILCDNRVKDYAIFVIVSLAAAYTHYYCLISVTFFYIVLILVAIIKEHKRIFRVAITCIATIIGYLPWFFVLLKTFQRTSDNYWLEGIATFKESLYYLFCSKYQEMLTIIFLIMVIVYLLWASSIVKIGCNSKMFPKITIDLSNPKINIEMIWVLAGCLSIFGTMGVGIGVSIIFRPMFQIKYVFPVATVAWIILGVCVSKLKLKKIISFCLIAIILLSGIPQYYLTYTFERDANEALTTTLNTISTQIQEEDQILTDWDHINWTIADVYYPGVEHQMLTEATYEELDKSLTYWAILMADMNEEMKTVFNDKGFLCECVVDRGNMGLRTVWIYRISGNES